MPSRLFLASFAFLTSTAIASCAAPDDAPDLRMRVRWGLTDPSALPTDVERISVDVLVEGEEPDNSITTVANLMDSDGNGRRELVRGGLPIGVPFSMRITGEVASAPVYVGHVGPIVLSTGERRYVEPFMFRLDDSTRLASTGVAGRLLHTATPLPDGRVLIAGGFEGATPMTCPDGVVAGARCFVLTATDEALIYDPSTARFHEVVGDMLEARGGHTATVLPGGGVLIAGGATDALLVMSPQGATEPPMGGYAMSLLPRDLAGAETALATFEIFDPEANPEEEDVDSDGDAGRGGFSGAADMPSAPGRLDRARFLAAAALVPGTPRVLIAGGVGSPDASTTFVVFDVTRAGGYGVLEATTNTLVAPRVMAGAVAVGTGANAAVWIIGGSDATSDAGLAEVWRADALDPNGASTSAADAPTMFPMQMAGTPASRPEWSLTQPLVAPIMGGTRVLAVGWYGPLCGVGVPTPVFAGVVDPSERCAFAATRSFTIDVSTGLAVTTMTGAPHAFGASAVLDDGRVVVTGGITTLQWATTTAIDVFTGNLDATGAAALSPVRIMLSTARAMHTSTPLPDGGVLTFGGVSFGANLVSASLPGPEVLYLR